MSADTHVILDDPTKVWEMIKRIDTCMFITQPAAGPEGRPMSTIPMHDENTIYLLTEPTTGAAQGVAANGDVLMSYQGGGDHVCISGKATIDPDKALVKRLWSAGAQAFWPDGPDASNVVVICVHPAKADYWDGPNPVVGAAKFAFGLLTGAVPDLGERGTANMGD